MAPLNEIFRIQNISKPIAFPGVKIINPTQLQPLMARFRCGFSDCEKIFDSEAEVREHQKKVHKMKPRRDETYWEKVV